MKNSRGYKKMMEQKGKLQPIQPCADVPLPDGINREDVVFRLDNTDVRENYLAVVAWEANRKAILFGYLWNGGVQYNFSVIDDKGETVLQDCIVVTSNYSTFYETRLKKGEYTIVFDNFPEVTREYKIVV